MEIGLVDREHVNKSDTCQQQTAYNTLLYFWILRAEFHNEIANLLYCHLHNNQCAKYKPLILIKYSYIFIAFRIIIYIFFGVFKNICHLINKDKLKR